MKGFERGRNLDKVGMKAQDTAELFFDDVRVPATNLLGKEGGGFIHLMEGLPQERLSIAVVAVAAARKILDITVDYCKERKAFGKPIGSFQHSRFVLAEMETEVCIAEQWLDRAISEHNAGRFDIKDAAMAKWWTTELQKRVVDQCVQLHGGYGYMLEYPVARAFMDWSRPDHLRRHDGDHEGDRRSVPRCLSPTSRSTRGDSLPVRSKREPGSLPPHYPTCFGCGPDAEFGMHVVARKVGEEIHATYTFSPKHSGAPGIAHGGTVAALVDDVCGFLLFVVQAAGGDPQARGRVPQAGAGRRDLRPGREGGQLRGAQAVRQLRGPQPRRGADLPRRRAVPRRRRLALRPGRRLRRRPAAHRALSRRL